MFRQIVFAAASLCLATSATAQTASAPKMGIGFVGQLRHDMTERQFLALNLRHERSISGSEGGDLIEYSVHFSDGNIAEMVFDLEGKSRWIETTSSDFATANGARVGDTVAKLQRVYPKGKIAKGLIEGLYFNFVVLDDADPSKVRAAFALDPTGLTDDCFIMNVGCPEFSTRRSISFRTW